MRPQSRIFPTASLVLLSLCFAAPVHAQEVWVTARDDASLQRFDEDGTLLQTDTMVDPVGVAVSDTDTWVAGQDIDNGCAASHLTQVPHDGGASTTFAAAGECISSVAIAPDGDVFVSGSMGGLVRYDVDTGAFLWQTRASGTWPFGVASDADGDFYVSYSNWGVVSKLDGETGTTLATSPFLDGAPKGIAVSAYDGDTVVWVALREGGHDSDLPGLVARLDADLNLLGAVEPIVDASGTPQLGAAAVTVDIQGRAWITNEGSGSITLLSADGASMETFASGARPVGVSLSCDGGVFVADADGDVLVHHTADGLQESSFATGAGPRMFGDGTGRYWRAHVRDASSGEQSAEDLLLDASCLLSSVDSSVFDAPGHVVALQNHVDQALDRLLDGKLSQAIKKVEDAMERTDGCPLRGTPDGHGSESDWIVDCSVQEVLYEQLLQALVAMGG